MLPQTLRQVVIVSGIVVCCISDGFIFGQMSGMVDTLLSKDSDIPLTESDVSWIAATINATCVCGFGLAALIADKYGRRRAITMMSLPLIGVWVLLYCAQNVATFIVSRVLVGLCFGGVLFLVIVMTGEYVSPNIRSLCLNMSLGGGNALGTMLGHILSIFFHWRTVALLGIIPAGLSALLPCFWVESPPWLASKGRFKKCEEAFRALHSHRIDAETELQLLIETEKYKQSNSICVGSPSSLAVWKSTIRQKYFWKIVVLASVITVYRVAAGKVLLNTFAITMLQEMTGSSDILMFTLLVDGFSVIGGCLSCIFITHMKMRTLLFTSALIANGFLLTLSASLYFKTDNNIYLSWINCALLALYCITMHAGPYPVLETLYGEIYPMEIKGTIIFVLSVMGSFMFFVSIRYATDMFAAMGYHGVFLLNIVVMSLCLAYLWVKLPETKGRTLAEIEMYFKNDTFNKTEHFLNGERTKVFI